MRRPRIRSGPGILAILTACALLRPTVASAQTDSVVPARRIDLTAGSAVELRVARHRLSALRLPVSVRPLGPRILDSLLGTPSADFHTWDRGWTAIWINTQRAYNDGAGPVWRGRGSTVSLSGGLAGRAWGFSYALRPVAFWTQNLEYDPAFSTSSAGFRDPWMPGIDRPYRLGSSSHGRLDAGESYLRYDSRFVGLGLSNAAQVWGPAQIHPLVMSNHAGGFPHLFVETGTPRTIGIGKLHGRWVAGQLKSSSFGPGADKTRLGVGAVGTFLPRGIDGLEIGGSRFFHLYDAPGARDLESLTLPISGLLKNRLRNPDGGPDHRNNQLASVFARFAPPGGRSEVYGEFFREDHSGDWRDLMLQPDHISAYTLGVKHGWESGAERRSILTIEAANGRITHLDRLRPQSSPYTHTEIIEGHTLRGMTLGSPAMPGGGALSARLDRVAATGAWSFVAEVVRTAQNREGGTFNGLATGFYNLGAARELVRGGRRWVATAYVQPGFGDVPGTNLSASIRVAH